MAAAAAADEDLFGVWDEVVVVLLRGRRAACVSTAGGRPRPQSADAALDKRELQKRAISLQDFPLEPGSARRPVSLIPAWHPLQMVASGG